MVFMRELSSSWAFKRCFKVALSSLLKFPPLTSILFLVMKGLPFWYFLGIVQDEISKQSIKVYMIQVFTWRTE